VALPVLDRASSPSSPASRADEQPKLLAEPDATDHAVNRPPPAEALERIVCPSCGAQASTRVLYGRDRLFGREGWYPVVQCAECSLRYLNPRPTELALREHYPRDYLPVRSPDAMSPFMRWLTRAMVAARWKVYLRMVENVIGAISPSARVVDVGCGLNDFLVHLERVRGCRGTGVDIDREVAAYIRDRLSMPVAHGTLRGAHLDAASFDLVTMNEYLEHEPDPLETLIEARRIAKKGAHLVVEVPHSSGLPARLFGSCWSQLDVPRHLIFYSPEALRAMLSRAGFRLLHVKPFGAPFSIGISLLQTLGFTRLGRLNALDTILLIMAGLPFLPFVPLLPEFMLCVAQAE
jgi:SAM-dependent methyltransferase